MAPTLHSAFARSSTKPRGRWFQVMATIRITLSGFIVGLAAFVVAALPPQPAGAASTTYVFAPPSMVVGEASGSVSLPVTLSAPSTSTVTVAYNVPGSNCNYPNQASSGTLTFAPGVVSQNVPVTINQCNVAALNFFTLTLSAPTNATIARATTQVDVVGDNNLEATPGLYVKNAVVDTTAGTVQVPVLLGGPSGATSASTVSVNYTTTNGSAVAGTDYTTTSNTLTFGPGQTEQNITVPIIDRTSAAASRSFSVTLSSPTNAVITQGTGVVTIGASGGTTVSSPNIFAPPNTVVGEADGWMDLPVTLSAPSANLVTVAYNVPGSNCNYPNQGSSGTLSFVPGVVLQAIRVQINQCNAAALNFFTLTLSAPTNATIARATTQVDVVGDNNLEATPGLYVKNAVVDTTAGTVQVPVLLGGPSGATSASTVSVNYTTTNGSAVAGTDYTTTSNTLTFGPGQTEQNITVPIIDRTSAAASRSFSVTLSSPTNAVITQGTGVVTIGASGGTTVSSPNIFAPPNTVVGEADGWMDLPVTLSAPSANLVTVAYNVPGSNCNYPNQGSSGTLSFVPGVVLQAIRVQINQCNAAALNFFTLTLSAPTNATIARATTQVDVVGDNNLEATPGLYVKNAVVDTTAGTVQVPVLLGGPSGATSASTVSVNYTTTNGSAVAGTDYTTTSNTLTFGPGQTEQNITVPIIDRTSAAASRSFSVTLSSPTNAVITQGTGVVTIGASGGTTVSSPNIFAPPNTVVGEADGWMDLPVTLSAPSANLVTVAYNVPGSNCNYPNQGSSGTLSFVPGVVLQAIRVQINQCNVTTNQTFTLTLSGATNATIARATTTVTVVHVEGSLTSLTPSRILDTRSNLGATGPVASGGTVSLQVDGAGGIPASGVAAVVLNVTVTQPADGGYLTVYPDGGSRPTTSALNFSAGETVPNLVIAPVGADGKVDFFNGSSGTVQVLADVSGWFASGTAGAGGLTPLTPSRILDTRSNLGATGPVASGGTVSLQVDGAGGIPASGVAAVVLNVTVTQPADGGYLTVYPDGGSRPTTSALNFSAGETVPNLVIAPVGADGKVDFFNGSSGTVQVLADVSGWFASGTAGAGGLTPLTPSRILDTRSNLGATGPVASGGTVSLQVDGAGGIPASGVAAVVLNVTVTQPADGGYLTVYPDGGSRPTTSALNFSAGETVPNLVIAPVGADGKVDFFNGSSGTVQVLADVSGWFSTQ